MPGHRGMTLIWQKQPLPQRPDFKGSATFISLSSSPQRRSSFVWMSLCYLNVSLGKPTPQPAAEAGSLTAQMGRSRAGDPAQLTARDTTWNLLYDCCLGRRFVVDVGIQQFVFISSVDVLAYFTLGREKEWKCSYWRGSLGLSRGYGIGNLSAFFSPYNSVWFNQHSVTVQNLN